VYFADVINTANSEIITLVDSAYEGEIQPTNAQILAQYNSILDILKKANAVKDLGGASVEALLDAEGGDVAINGTDTGITGGNVTSATGDVDIIGSTTNTLSGVSVGGKDVSVTGGEVSVTNGTVAGTAAVTRSGISV
jgi:hypothetical protein